jgi:RimJ/RimL family protein N-acetyltransferase
VEIAYFTFPAFEGRGFATAMAAALVERAWAAGAAAVVAHTLPTPNASNHLLGKLGFQLAGTVEDPEDGAVWRWAIRAPGSAGPRGGRSLSC